MAKRKGQTKHYLEFNSIDFPLKLHDNDNGLSPIAWQSNVELSPFIMV
jgi:hypothetical protein